MYLKDYWDGECLADPGVFGWRSCPNPCCDEKNELSAKKEKGRTKKHHHSMLDVISKMGFIPVSERNTINFKTRLVPGTRHKRDYISFVNWPGDLVVQALKEHGFWWDPQKKHWHRVHADDGFREAAENTISLQDDWARACGHWMEDVGEPNGPY